MSNNISLSFLKNLIKKNFGIGKQTGNYIAKNAGINTRIYTRKTKSKQLNDINRETQQLFLGKKLKDKIKNNINFLIKTKTYKGIRHKLKYPARGQRTHTNAKNKKNFKY